MRNLSWIGLALTLPLVSGLLPAVGHAHIDPLPGMNSRSPRSGLSDSTQKAVPCDGALWGVNGSYTFQPGATITVGVRETLPHPGYFRIAFDRDATASFKDPVSIKPIKRSRARACPVDRFDHCEGSDFCTQYPEESGVTVLWDNLDPHPGFNRPKWTWKIKLPDIECEKCTLQIIQIMEDSVHGGYCPTGACKGDTTLPDVYHRCIDITLKSGAPKNPGINAVQTREPNGIDCSKAQVANGQMTFPFADVHVVDGPDDSADVELDEESSDSSAADAGVAAEADGESTPAASESGEDSASGCALTGTHAGSSSSAFGLLLLGACGWLRRRRSALGR